MGSRFVWFVPAISIALGILALSTFLTVPIQVEGVSHLDKWEHTFAYMVLSFSFLLALYKSQNLSNKRSVIVLLSACGYGLFLEFVQFQFFPDRYFEWVDAISNVLGTILGFIIFNVSKKSI